MPQREWLTFLISLYASAHTTNTCTVEVNEVAAKSHVWSGFSTSVRHVIFVELRPLLTSFTNSPLMMLMTLKQHPSAEEKAANFGSAAKETN